MNRVLANLARMVCAAAAIGALSPAAIGETVLTGTQATFSIATALAAATPIEIVNVPEDGRELALLADYIERRLDRLTPVLAEADAVVSLANALPGDPLYRFAREANIRVVAIEAAVPWSPSMPGVALTDSPVSTVDWAVDAETPTFATAPYFWLSISNAIRMADIVAHDLSALYPDSSAAIARNLENLKVSLLRMRSEHQRRLIAAADDTVFALTGDFVYLTNDLGLFVDGYFIKQDVRWTDDDHAALTSHLLDRDIRVVIHKWNPSETIQAAIAAASARLVVLQSGDPGISDGDTLAGEGLQQILNANLEALTGALSAQ